MWPTFLPPTSKGLRWEAYPTPPTSRGMRQRNIVAELQKGKMFLGYLFFHYLYWLQHKNYMAFPLVKSRPSSKLHVGFKTQLNLNTETQKCTHRPHFLLIFIENFAV